jgi:HD superfamily phosphohydrolase
MFPLTPTTESAPSVVMDPVHGAIALAGHEKRIIDHPLVQRLRYVSQTDVTHLVFPGATHSRFSHSIGVMHVASLSLDAVIRSLMSQLATQTPSSAVMEAFGYFRFMVRAAGALHDLGHGPFSHQFEHSESLRKLVTEASVTSRLWDGLQWRNYLVDEPKGFSHSAYSIRLAHSLLEDLSGAVEAEALPIEAHDVLCLLEGSAVKPSRVFSRHCEVVYEGLDIDGLGVGDVSAAMLSVLRSIIYGTINADTLDWVLRDSYFTGSAYGSFNLDYLISSLRLGYSVDQGMVSWAGLAIAEKGLGVFEQLAFARLQLYRRVYSHKTVAGFKILLAHALEEVLQDPMTRREVGDALSDPVRMRALHDATLWARFTDYALSEPDSASHDLVSRKKPRALQQLQNPTTAKLQEAQLQLANKYPRLRILKHEALLRSSLTGDDAEPVRVLSRDEGATMIRDLQDVPGFEWRHFDLRITNLVGVNAGWARTKPAQAREKGFLICGAGLPCTGKSSVLRHLAGRLGARYFREPEEIRWPEAVTRREEMGLFTALTWFRSVRVQNLVNAANARDAGEAAVVDSYYDKMIHCYLGKPAVEWLLPRSNPHFEAFALVAERDFEDLPDADLVVVFRVSESDWHRFLAIRNRKLDQNPEFLRSFESQEYFLDAARQLAERRGIPFLVFERKFVDSPTPVEDAADQLLEQIQSRIPESSR